MGCGGGKRLSQQNLEKIRKERDHYKLHFNRLSQEKEALQTVVHDSKVKSEQQNGQIKLLNAKIDSIVKEKTMSQLDKDKLQSKVRQLEEMIEKGLIVGGGTGQNQQKAGAGRLKPATIASHNPYLSMTLPTAKSDGYAEAHIFKAHDKGISWYCISSIIHHYGY